MGIARDGSQVRVSAWIYSIAAIPIYDPNSAYVRVPAGLHWIGADVVTPGPGGSVASDTMVMRRMRITRSQTVKLDARPGRLLRLTLPVPGAVLESDAVQACVSGRFVVGPGVSAGGFADPLYVVPVRSGDITFSYGGKWQSPAAGYMTSAQQEGGIPSRPDYRIRLSDLAKLEIAVRSGTVPGGFVGPSFQSGQGCGEGWGVIANPAGMITEYVTAGSWTASIFGVQPYGFWSNASRFRAGHRYDVVFGGAVFGPGHEAPRAGVGGISYMPDTLFADPGQPYGVICCAQARIVLARGSHVLERRVLGVTPRYIFRARARAAGWYTMRIRAWRGTPQGVTSADVLSRLETLTWRFYATPSVVVAGVGPEVPAAVVRIWPRGLNIDNQAAPGGVTVLDVHVVRTHDSAVVRAPWHRLRTVRMQASFNGGKTWQALRLIRRTGHWLARVHDPASGMVALRAVVIDAAGDSTVQTIYQAFAIG
jgi:hypothetical protein